MLLFLVAYKMTQLFNNFTKSQNLSAHFTVQFKNLFASSSATGDERATLQNVQKKKNFAKLFLLFSDFTIKHRYLTIKTIESRANASYHKKKLFWF